MQINFACCFFYLYFNHLKTKKKLKILVLEMLKNVKTFGTHLHFETVIFKTLMIYCVFGSHWTKGKLA